MIPPLDSLTDAQLRLRGLFAAKIEIDSLIKEAREACSPYGKRQGYKLSWWRGNFSGLVAAKSMLVLADFPKERRNAAQIKQLVKAKRAPLFLTR